MITADPQRRVSTLARILDHVGRTAPDDCVGRYLSHDRRDRSLVCLPRWPAEPVGGCTRESASGR